MGPHILWAIIAGFLSGVFIRSTTELGLAFVGFLAFLALALLILSALEKKRQVLVLAVGLLAAASGMLRMDAAALAPDPTLEEQFGEKVLLEGVVFQEPDVREGNVRLSIKLPHGTGVLAVVPAHSPVAYGDIVRVEGTLRAVESFETGEGREFDYPGFLAKDGVTYQLSFGEVEVVGRGAVNPLKSFAISVKQKFLEGLALVLPEPHAGLAGGITVGDKRGLGEELGETFRIVGLTHIVVLSGYNIMIVMEGLARMLGWFHASRYLRLGATIFVALFFAFMTGFASASVRAALMAVIAVAGRVSGRMYLAGRALGVVALLMVLWNPFILVYDPGFQLSILATAGLISFTPAIITRLRMIPTKLGFREIAATTLGTQIAVLPLLLYQSGQFPLFSLPANLFALIVVPWAMLFSTFASIARLLLGPLAVVVAAPAYALLSYIIGVGNLLASLPYASLSLPSFSPWLLMSVYALLFTLLFMRNTNKKV